MVTRPREELYERINRRVEQMVAKGLVEEVRSLLPYREYNALNTIGYKEIFQYLDGDISLEEATRLIAKHSRIHDQPQPPVRRTRRRQVLLDLLTGHRRTGVGLRLAAPQVDAP